MSLSWDVVGDIEDCTNHIVIIAVSGDQNQLFTPTRDERRSICFWSAVSLSWDDVQDFELPNLYIVHCGHSVQIQCVGPAAKGRTFTFARII